MILKDLKKFSQNIQKNNFIINTILETNNNFNIIFIQELSWTTLCSISSPSNCKGNPLVGVVNHSNWLTFAREPDATNDCPRVVMFINIRLSSFHFSFHKDVINHRDILLAPFFNNGNIFWLMNIYSDSLILSALYLSPFLHILEKCLKNLNLKISILSFVNDGLLIMQSKSFYVSNT